jgi:hypothetical protein
LQVCLDADLFAGDQDLYRQPDLHRNGVFLFQLRLLLLHRRLRMPRLLSERRELLGIGLFLFVVCLLRC